MDLSRTKDGHLHFRLGPVERWVIIAAAALLTGSLGYVFHSVTGQQDDQAKAIKEQNALLGDLKEKQAVTNSKLETLTSQLADVPSLTRQMAELKVQTERNTQDIHDLQQVRRLK